MYACMYVCNGSQLDATDENGNTALLYAASKGYRQSTAALLRSA